MMRLSTFFYKEKYQNRTGASHSHSILPIISVVYRHATKCVANYMARGGLTISELGRAIRSEMLREHRESSLKKMTGRYRPFPR